MKDSELSRSAILNPQTELARKRNQAAAERTLMAWIRTSLSLISFGFGIDQIVAAIRAAVGEEVNPVFLSRFLGLSFIALGVFAVLGAAYQHRQELKHIRQEHYTYIPERSLGLMVATTLIIIGIIAFLGILINAIFGVA
jgi:putative membrane protein